jgi:hypothetical protein
MAKKLGVIWGRQNKRYGVEYDETSGNTITRKPLSRTGFRGAE